MALTDMVIMPGTDYQDACDAIREKTGGTATIKSGDMGTQIRSISGAVYGEATLSTTGTSITITNIIGKDNVALMFMDDGNCPANAMEDAGIINVIIHGESHYYVTHYSTGLLAYGNDGFIVYNKTTGRISLSGAYNEAFIAGKYMYVAW